MPSPPLPRGLTLTGALIGSLNNKVGDGYKNVAYKVKLHCFKLIALTLFHSIRQIVAIFFESNSKSLFQSSQKENKVAA